MYENDVWWLENFNVVLCRFEVSMRRKTLIVHLHFSIDDRPANVDFLVLVNHSLGKRSFYTISSEYDSIEWVWRPFNEKLATWAVLKHTWWGHDYEGSFRVGNRFQPIVVFKFEGIVATFKLHSEFVAHQVSVSVEDTESAICQVALIVDRYVA